MHDADPNAASLKSMSSVCRHRQASGTPRGQGRAEFCATRAWRARESCRCTAVACAGLRSVTQERCSALAQVVAAAAALLRSLACALCHSAGAQHACASERGGHPPPRHLCSMMCSVQLATVRVAGRREVYLLDLDCACRCLYWSNDRVHDRELCMELGLRWARGCCHSHGTDSAMASVSGWRVSHEQIQRSRTICTLEGRASTLVRWGWGCGN